MSVIKTTYKLLPTQYKFAYGFDKSKLSDDNIYLDVSLYQGGFTCVPSDTEYLSPTGWKQIKDLTKQDKLAVYYDDGSIKYEHPKEVFRYPADEWYEFKTTYTHQVLCPNHKIVYFSQNDTEMLHPKFISCKDYVDAGCNQHYKIRNYFKSSSGYELPLTDYELRLLVAYQADGYDYQKVHHCGKRTLGFHLKKKNKIERLLSILNNINNCQFTVKERLVGTKKGYVDVFVEENKELSKYKHFTPEMYSLSDRQLAIIFDEVKYWDCSHKNSKNTNSYGSWTYSAREKADRDFIQFVCASQGYCTTCYERTRNIKLNYNSKEYIYNNSTEYTVSWSLAKPLSLGKATRINAKGGDAKYCPSTTTGMWLARYKNYIFVTGNS